MTGTVETRPRAVPVEGRGRPYIHSHDEHVIPYEIMRWFMDWVADQVKLGALLRRGSADAVRTGWPWRVSLEDRALLVVVYWSAARFSVAVAAKRRAMEADLSTRTGVDRRVVHIYLI